MFGDCNTTLATLTIGLLLALLAHRATAVKCWTSHTGLLKHPSHFLKSCSDRHIGCHEHFHTLRGFNTAAYDAGCGPYIMRMEMQVLTDIPMVEQKDTECFTDGCNAGFIGELEASHRICHWANRGSSFTSTAIVCAKNETKCFLDSMTGAKDPAYLAGCGACPSYTLYCSTCTSNYCNNGTAPKAVLRSARVVYVDGPSGGHAAPDYSFDTEAALPAAAPSCPVAIAGLASLVMMLLLLDLDNS